MDNIFESFRTDDNLVGKYIHVDNSETAIKSVSSCDTVLDPATGQFHHYPIDRRKYSIFISSSAGCYMSCNFCYLTMKKAKYGKLNADKILNNLKQAVIAESEDNPDIKDRWVKLNWMGMGEDHMIHPQWIEDVTVEMLNWLVDNGYAKGLDGVDVASVLGKGTNHKVFESLQSLENTLQTFEVNPNNSRVVHTSNAFSDYVERSRVRFFYSLHAGLQSTRNNMIPNALPLDVSIPLLTEYSQNNKHNLIFHQLFIEDQNDSEADVDALLELVNKHNLQQFEFRILRYNHCRLTHYYESKKFEDIIAKISKELPRIKVQISTGKEVAAACGQFIVRNFKK